jgi:hypothetical protein
MKKILIKTPQCEINFDNLCDKEYQKINNIMNLIEKEFQTDMNEHSEIRHEILDISNFIKRLPTMISEVIE